VPNGDALCSVQVTGAGRLIGLDNGDQRDMTSLQSPSRKLSQGRALAVVECSREAGAIELTVTAPGLPDAHLQLRTK
jgi:beta-galactosidase